MDKNYKTNSFNYSACLGTVVACIVSWTTWHSIPWVILHGMLGWLYVIYWALFV